jgi:hypothetical protein
VPPPTAYSNTSNDDDEDHYGPVNSPPSRSRPPSSQTQRAKTVKEPSSLPYQFPTSPSPTPINSAYAPSSMTPLRPEQSFHFHS